MNDLMTNDPELPPEFDVASRLDALASKLGWKRISRHTSERRISLVYEKMFEPEPGEGRVDPA